MTASEALRWRNVTAVPAVHGRLPFALDVRRRMLETRFRHVAVELPATLKSAVLEAIDALPTIHVVVYREVVDWAAEATATFDGDDADPGRQVFYVPIDPCDAMIEATRIAQRERAELHFIDAEIEDFDPRPMVVPDAHAIHGLGLDAWYEAVLPALLLESPSPQDDVRERHMAASLRMLAQFAGDEPVLFVCGLAHWHRIREHLERSGDQLHEADGPEAEEIRLARVHPRSLIHLLGEMPYLAYLWERHRRGISPDRFDAVEALKGLVLRAKSTFERRHPDSLEQPTLPALRACFAYLRKLVVYQRRLLPDPYLLTLAAKSTVGNDFAVRLLELTNRYPPNRDRGDALEMTAEAGRIGDGDLAQPMTSRAPGEAREFRPLELIRRPRRRQAQRWRRGWNPHSNCSWPPEDVAIENFRDHVTRRARSAVSVVQRRTEPFVSSLKDGLAIRETLRDPEQAIHVREEPPVAGEVGGLVLVFEEDDDGTRFPWRITWYAEHDEESTLAFYATDPLDDLVGPGIARIRYGGCMFLYPPIAIPDVWDDLRFERARRPSERLLLASLFWSREKFIAYAAPTPPAPEVKAEAARLGKHVIYLPLSSFSPHALERMRRAHVLNDGSVRGYASQFIG